MIRVSKRQLAERWALTYAQDGYDVRATDVPGRQAPDQVSGFRPDLEATRGHERVLVHIIASPESLVDEETPAELRALAKARRDGAHLHVIVAAECAHEIKERLQQWHVQADAVHIT